MRIENCLHTKRVINAYNASYHSLPYGKVGCSELSFMSIIRCSYLLPHIVFHSCLVNGYGRYIPLLMLTKVIGLSSLMCGISTSSVQQLTSAKCFILCVVVSISSSSPPIPLNAHTRPNIRFDSDSDDSASVTGTGSLPPAPKIQGPGFNIKSAIQRRALSPQLHTRVKA